MPRLELSILLFAGAYIGCPAQHDATAALDSGASSAASAPAPSASSAMRDASAEASADASANAAGAADAAVDPATLPQTRDKPESTGPAFEARVSALWDGIVADDPERALPFFFPRAAYAQVKAIANPNADWKSRLVAAYSRDIHELHKRLGKDPTSAKLVGLEVAAGMRWVDPGEEYNKIGYFRVFNSRLRFERPAREGSAPRSESFEVKSLISWRGEWFVVHLSGMK